MKDHEALKEAKKRWGDQYGDRVFCMRPFGFYGAGATGTDEEDGFYFSGDSWEEVFKKADGERNEDQGSLQ